MAAGRQGSPWTEELRVRPHQLSRLDQLRTEVRRIETGSSWYRVTVDFGGTGMGRRGRVYVTGPRSESGYPHISYHAFPEIDELKYAYRDGSGWHREGGRVDWNSGGKRRAPGTEKIARPGDESGSPHISYFDSWGGGWEDLKYAYRETVQAGWGTETVDCGWECG